MSIDYPVGDTREDMQRAFQAELARLAVVASRNNVVEGVMRLRALGEIAAMLDTPALLDLAGQTAEHAPAGPRGRGHAMGGRGG